MKCIDDELIQRYIDGETDFQETVEIERHTADCSPCTLKIEEQRAFADAVKRQLENWNSQPVVIPEFVAPAVNKRNLNIKIRRYIYAASAACAAFLLFFLISEHYEQNREDEMLLIYSFDGVFDSNKPVSQQEMNMIMMDTHGKVVEYK